MKKRKGIVHKSFDKTEREIYFRRNAIKTDAVIFIVIGVWIGAMCKLFSLILPFEDLIFQKFLFSLLIIFCIFPFLVLVIKNSIMLIYLRKKQKRYKKY